MLSYQGYFCLFFKIITFLSLLFLLYHIIHQIFSISHPFISSQTLSCLFLSFQLLFQTKMTCAVSIFIFYLFNYFLFLIYDLVSLERVDS